MKNRPFEQFLSAKDIIFKCDQLIEKNFDNEKLLFIFCTYLIRHCCRKIDGLFRQFFCAKRYFASLLRKLCFREKIFFRDISVRVLRIV